MHFLGFRLYAPLASFGDVAVGGLRPSLTAPTRSMILGLVAACLGIKRDDVDQQAKLEKVFGVATRTDSPGVLLADFHTAQAPDGPRRNVFLGRHGFQVGTRRDELSATYDRNGARHPLDTQLSQRHYRMDAAYAVCLWIRIEPSPWSLELLQKRFLQPVFAPFAGRKSAAIALPFEPTIVENDNPVEALRTLQFSLDPKIGKITRAARQRVYRWEGSWAGLSCDRTEMRRDSVLSRDRWQFLTREEHVFAEPYTGEARDVSL